MDELSRLKNDNAKLHQDIEKSEAEKNILVREEKNDTCSKIECKAKLSEKNHDYETLSLKHANLLVAKKELEDELMAKICSTEVADELAAVKFELKRLHGILAEKEKELQHLLETERRQGFCGKEAFAQPQDRGFIDPAIS